MSQNTSKNSFTKRTTVTPYPKLRATLILMFTRMSFFKSVILQTKRLVEESEKTSLHVISLENYDNYSARPHFRINCIISPSVIYKDKSNWWLWNFYLTGKLSFIPQCFSNRTHHKNIYTSLKKREDKQNLNICF